MKLRATGCLIIKNKRLKYYIYISILNEVFNLKRLILVLLVFLLIIGCTGLTVQEPKPDCYYYCGAEDTKWSLLPNNEGDLICRCYDDKGQIIGKFKT